MPIISLILAMDKKRGIGKQNALLCHLPADLKHFKEVTMGKPIIMGHNTYLSIGKPLPGRLNIVLSRQSRKIAGVTVVHSLEDALFLVKDAPEVMIIGGETLFQQSLLVSQRIYITLIHHQFEADVHFPELDPERWVATELLTKPSDEKNKYDMTFYRYDLHSALTVF
ncbi:MAG: dihydrofolate reductase [Legionellaceae bacterium]|nr:dihydrofolate reductase [Legionellaceae bacterium]